MTYTSFFSYENRLRHYLIVATIAVAAISCNNPNPASDGVNAAKVVDPIFSKFGYEMEMVFVEGNGTIDNFYIGKFEVTQRLWFLVMGTTVMQQREKKLPYLFEERYKKKPLNNFLKEYPIPIEGDNYPISYVSWNEAQEFMERLNSITGKHYRLPTVAEWQYAARGGNKSRGYEYSGSNNIHDVAWWSGSSRDSHYYKVTWQGKEYSLNDTKSRARPVGTKQPNELGIYDMSGNVEEWCLDTRGYYIHYGRMTNVHNRVYCGGSFWSVVSNCRVVSKYYSGPDWRCEAIGFRIVLVP